MHNPLPRVKRVKARITTFADNQSGPIQKKMGAAKITVTKTNLWRTPAMVFDNISLLGEFVAAIPPVVVEGSCVMMTLSFDLVSPQASFIAIDVRGNTIFKASACAITGA